MPRDGNEDNPETGVVPTPTTPTLPACNTTSCARACWTVRGWARSTRNGRIDRALAEARAGGVVVVAATTVGAGAVACFSVVAEMPAAVELDTLGVAAAVACDCDELAEVAVGTGLTV